MTYTRSNYTKIYGRMATELWAQANGFAISEIPDDFLVQYDETEQGAYLVRVQYYKRDESGILVWAADNDFERIWSEWHQVVKAFPDIDFERATTTVFYVDKHDNDADADISDDVTVDYDTPAYGTAPVQGNKRREEYPYRLVRTGVLREVASDRTVCGDETFYFDDDTYFTHTTKYPSSLYMGEI